jgi:hypothetical protein
METKSKQEQLIELVNKWRIIAPLKNGEKNKFKISWRKYNGDIVCRIFIKMLQDELSNYCEVVGPNAFINEFPNEFDILLLSQGSRKIDDYSNRYNINDVRIIIESKVTGIIGNHEEIIHQFDKLKLIIKDIQELNDKIIFIYLTFEERCNPKKSIHNNYYKIAKDALGKHEVFCMYCLNDKKIRENEWERFIKHIKNHLEEKNHRITRS